MALTEQDGSGGRSLIPDEELVALVALHYYRDGLTQGEIGDRLGLSRIKVSRLLDRGRQSGLIQVTINSPFEGCFALQARLTEQFGLVDARVIPGLEGSAANERVAQTAAHHLVGRLGPGELLAIGWGDTVSRALRFMAPTLMSKAIDLVSLTGGVAAYLDGIGFHGSRSSLHLIPTPLRVSSPEFAQALRREPFVRDVLAMALTARTALVGVGSLEGEPTLLRNGFCSRSELDLFRRQGAVGDVLGYFFDAQGTVLPLDLHERVVAVELDRLAGLETVIAAAAGADKVTAILAALRGGHADVLITDEPTARAVLQEGGV